VPAPRRRPPAFERERRGLGWVGWSIGGLALAAGVSAGVLWLYAPVDLVRDRLVAEVKARTGRTLTVGSVPSIRFWPTVAVSLRDVSLSNPPGMGGPPMLTMARLDATIDLWPLLSRRVVVDQLTLHAPAAVLRVEANGRRNWDFAALAPPRAVQVASAGPLRLEDLPEDLRAFAQGANDVRRIVRAPGSGDVALGRVRIIDGRIQYDDRPRGVSEVVERINLTLEAPDPKAALQAAGTLSWRGEAIRLDTRVAPARALIDGTGAQSSTAIGAGPVQVTYTGTLGQDAFGPKLDGQFTARTPSLARAATWLGRGLTGAAADGPAQLRGRIVTGQGRSVLSDATVSITGLQASGALTLEAAAARPKLSGSLRVAEADLEKLAGLRLADPSARPLPPPATIPAGRAAPTSIEDLLREPAPAPSQPQVRGFLSRDGWSEQPLDLTALGVLDADLKVAFTRVAAADGLHVGPGAIGLVLTNRVARLTVDDLTLFEGKTRGTVTLDGAAARPTLAINLTSDQVALQPLLRATGHDGLDGRGRIVLNVTSSGRTERQLIDALAGRAEVTVPRGAVLGFDLSSAVQGLASGRLPRFAHEPGTRTEFSDLGASFSIARGIADNRDFRITAREARAVGSGQIALGPRTIDATLRPRITSAVQVPSGLGGASINLSALDIPVRITGPLAKPEIAADFGEAFKSPGQIMDAAKAIGGADVETTVKGLLSGDPDAKAKARDVLNNLLKR
jgi:AsmA protein